MKRGQAVRILVALMACGFLLFSCGSEKKTVEDGDTDTQDNTEISDTDTNEADTQEEAELTDGDLDIADGDSDPMENESIEEEAVESEESVDTIDTDTSTECINLTGAYTIAATCNSSSFYMPTLTCVSQTECAVSLNTAPFDFTGTTTTGDYTVSSAQPFYPTTCTGAPKEDGTGYSIACSFEGASMTCSGSVAPLSLSKVRDATSLCCDVMTQNCPGENERCQVVDFSLDDSVPTLAACIPVEGTAALGENCTRENSEISIGRDTCAKGGYCSLLGSGIVGQRKCLPYCTKPDDCVEGYACALITSVPRVGTCAKSCDLFGTGAECGEGSLCTMITDVRHVSGGSGLSGFCYPGTGKAEGESCTYNTECATGLACSAIAMKCTKICNETDHPCTAGNCAHSFLGDGTYGVCTAASASKNAARR